MGNEMSRPPAMSWPPLPELRASNQTPLAGDLKQQDNHIVGSPGILGSSCGDPGGGGVKVVCNLAARPWGSAEVWPAESAAEMSRLALQAPIV